MQKYRHTLIFSLTLENRLEKLVTFIQYKEYCTIACTHSKYIHTMPYNEFISHQADN